MSALPLRAKFIAVFVATAVSACASSTPALPAPAAAAGVVDADAQGSASAQAQRPVLNAEVLPSMVNSVTVKADTPLLQRPKAGSVILKTLAAGDTVQLLGTLDNADGQWRSVAVGDSQGWLRAEQVSP